MKKYMNNERSAYIGCGYSLVGIILLLIAALFLSGCKTVKYVPVSEVHEHWHHQTDTIMRTDSIIDHHQTIIREVDSATMAQYGIELKQMQRAWLIESNRLQKQLSELMQSHTDTIIERDTIPMPYPYEVEVPAQLSWWQQTRIHLGELLIAMILAIVGWWVYKRKP